MTNAELFVKAMIVGGGFAFGATLFIGMSLLVAVIIGGIASEDRHGD